MAANGVHLDGDEPLLRPTPPVKVSREPYGRAGAVSEFGNDLVPVVQRLAETRRVEPFGTVVWRILFFDKLGWV